VKDAVQTSDFIDSPQRRGQLLTGPQAADVLHEPRQPRGDVSPKQECQHARAQQCQYRAADQCPGRFLTHVFQAHLSFAIEMFFFMQKIIHLHTQIIHEPSRPGFTQGGNGCVSSLLLPCELCNGVQTCQRVLGLPDNLVDPLQQKRIIAHQIMHREQLCLRLVP
jgi:hypothetical protein